jgi:hypothetical protein
MDARFPDDYRAARARFREAAGRLGCEVEEHAIAGRGPQGEALAIDVAIVPGGSSRSTLIVSSGIHGVEGFLGSAIQHGLLEEWRTGPPSVRCVLVHALNPFGFAWRRRVDEANVDLNRNLLGDGEGFRGSPELYAALDRVLNPKHPPRRWEPLTPHLLAALLRHGMPALKQALAAGQYEYPQGLFYGGNRPSPTSMVLATHFDRWLGASECIMHLDIHTGLGRGGTRKLLIDQPLTSVQSARLRGWFGSDSFEAATSTGVAYSARGTLGRWCAARAASRDYVYAAAEFGTYGLVSVLSGLRVENQAHHWCRPDDPALERSKRRLVELFCPVSDRWRSGALAAGQHLVARALHGLSTPGAAVAG